MTDIPFQWPGQRVDDSAHEMLAAFLVMDIQRNPEWARELSNRIAEVKAAKIPVWERIGNAYRLELTDQGVSIEDLVDENSAIQEVTLEDFCRAVEAWMKRI